MSSAAACGEDCLNILDRGNFIVCLGVKGLEEDDRPLPLVARQFLSLAVVSLH